jgi:MFS transporter, SP family, arabinose:H+ symporter
MFLFPAITSSLRLFLMTFKYKYETPKYLIQNGHHEEAIKSLKPIYSNAKEQYEILKEEIENSGEKKVTFADLMKPRIKPRFLVGCGLALLQQFTANNAIIFYSKRIFQNETPDNETLPTLYNTIVGFCNFSSAFVAAALIAQFGRKTILLAGNIIVTFTLVGYGVITLLLGEENFMLKYLLFIYSFAFGFSLGPLLWIYVAEILPDKGVAIAVLVNWLFTFAIAQVFPSMLTGLGDGVTLIFFGILSLLGNIFLVKCIKETKNKTDTEIEEMFNSAVRDSSMSKPFLSKIL